jgi:hypothetical protein
MECRELLWQRRQRRRRLREGDHRTLADDACIDNKRVFASGCSNGGGMSYRLACEAADVIAAVAPVDFDCVLGQGCGDCAPARPITVVQFRGTADQLVDYEGAGAFVGAQANLATWGEINECTDSAAALQQNDSCEGFASCGDGAQSILCTVQGGHALWQLRVVHDRGGCLGRPLERSAPLSVWRRRPHARTGRWRWPALLQELDSAVSLEKVLGVDPGRATDAG